VQRSRGPREIDVVGRVVGGVACRNGVVLAAALAIIAVRLACASAEDHLSHADRAQRGRPGSSSGSGEQGWISR
jgi:hypothetical protein